MVEKEPTVTINLADPTAVGLLAFGMTTILLALHNLQLYPIDSVILSMGIFYGGIAQVIAGMFEFKKGNTFGATAFTSYGFFWLTFVVITTGVLPGVSAAEPAALGAYFALWGILTLFMFFGTLKSSRAMQIIFLSLTVLFFLVAIMKNTDVEAVAYIAGAVGILSGGTAMYTAFSVVLQEQFGREILPRC